MAIFGIAFTIIAMIGGLFFSYTYSAKGSLDLEQVNKIGNELINNIQKIYFFGDTNRKTYKPTFPQGIESLTIHHINQSGYNYYYLNISLVSNGEIRDMIFQTTEDYIAIVCSSSCVNTNIEPGYDIATYNNSFLGQGVKNIRIEGFNNTVIVEFVE